MLLLCVAPSKHLSTGWTRENIDWFHNKSVKNTRMFCLLGCLYTTCMLGAQGDQKSALGPLVPELQTVISHYVDAGNGTWVAHCFWLLTHLSSVFPNSLITCFIRFLWNYLVIFMAPTSLQDLNLLCCPDLLQSWVLNLFTLTIRCCDYRAQLILWFGVGLGV